MSTLCIDFGNTRLKAAIFKEGIYCEEVNINNDKLSSFEELITKYNPTHTILASVIDHNTELEDFLNAKTQFHKITHVSKFNFSISVSKKETIGADRLALIAAACQLYPNRNNLIIGIGSCITYNFVNQTHQFLGGAISPGMEMRFKALKEYTSKLPLVTADWNFPLIGYDTKTNLQSGVIVGIINEINGFIQNYDEKYGNFNVVLTGGHSPYFASQLKNKIFADVNFLFKGLYALSEINNTSK
jgi:type III pantothenate kinase